MTRFVGKRALITGARSGIGAAVARLLEAEGADVVAADIAGTDVHLDVRNEAQIARQPLGRLGTPEEIAEAIAYLAFDAAGFVTGSVFAIDGGLTAA